MSKSIACLCWQVNTERIIEQNSSLEGWNQHSWGPVELFRCWYSSYKHCEKWWSHQPGPDTFTGGIWEAQTRVLWLCGAGLNLPDVQGLAWSVVQVFMCSREYNLLPCYIIFRFFFIVDWHSLFLLPPTPTTSWWKHWRDCENRNYSCCPGASQLCWHVHWITGMEGFLFQSEYLISIWFSGDWTHIESRM